jgi:hypothetical protein
MRKKIKTPAKLQKKWDEAAKKESLHSLDENYGNTIIINQTSDGLADFKKKIENGYVPTTKEIERLKEDDIFFSMDNDIY